MPPYIIKDDKKAKSLKPLLRFSQSIVEVMVLGYFLGVAISSGMNGFI